MARVKGIIGWIKARRAQKHVSPWDADATGDLLAIMVKADRRIRGEQA